MINRIHRCLVSFLLASMLGGCAAPLAPTVASLFVTQGVPMAIDGKGLAENGADLVTGKDCRVFAAAMRKGRKICEERGSPETKKDFKGLSGMKVAAVSTPRRLNE